MRRSRFGASGVIAAAQGAVLPTHTPLTAATTSWRQHQQHIAPQKVTASFYTWLATASHRCVFPRLCYVGYVQTIPWVFTPGITLQRTSVSSVGHSYPYQELLEVLYNIHTRTRNLWKFCTTRATIPGVQHVLYPLGTCVSSGSPCHNNRNFCGFCKTSIPAPETSGSSVRLPYPYLESTNPTEHNLVSFFVFSKKIWQCFQFRKMWRTPGGKTGANYQRTIFPKS